MMARAVATSRRACAVEIRSRRRSPCRPWTATAPRLATTGAPWVRAPACRQNGTGLGPGSSTCCAIRVSSCGGACTPQIATWRGGARAPGQRCRHHTFRDLKRRARTRVHARRFSSLFLQAACDTAGPPYRTLLHDIPVAGFATGEAACGTARLTLQRAVHRSAPGQASAAPQARPDTGPYGSCPATGAAWPVPSGYGKRVNPCAGRSEAYRSDGRRTPGLPRTRGVAPDGAA